MGMTTRVSWVEVGVESGADSDDDGTVVMPGGWKISLKSGKTMVGMGWKPGGNFLEAKVEVVDDGTEVAVSVVDGLAELVVKTGSTVVDGASTSGSIVRVTVTAPDETDTVTVLVNRSMDVTGPEVLVSVEELEPVAEVAVTPPVDDAVGSSASGIVPKISWATAMSLQPKITPSVVFMGIAKQALPAGQGISSNPSPLAHVPIFPETHAAWPSLQADRVVKVAKISLYFRASARLLSNTAGGTVLVAGGGVSMTVGIPELGVPVMVGLVDEAGSRVADDEEADVEDPVGTVEVPKPALSVAEVLDSGSVAEENEPEPERVVAVLNVVCMNVDELLVARPKDVVDVLGKVNDSTVSVAEASGTAELLVPRSGSSIELCRGSDEAAELAASELDELAGAGSEVAGSADGKLVTVTESELNRAVEAASVELSSVESRGSVPGNGSSGCVEVLTPELPSVDVGKASAALVVVSKKEVTVAWPAPDEKALLSLADGKMVESSMLAVDAVRPSLSGSDE
ncbi:hypothetical protein MFIFM68171_07735 [Madurella fahalii]|uniref:Uncharacterized protein n=1 Tax=Madurella fahalii TaxID=1157608 RepID=A0ABQ0GID8_9PEZI